MMSFDDWQDMALIGSLAEEMSDAEAERQRIEQELLQEAEQEEPE